MFDFFFFFIIYRLKQLDIEKAHVVIQLVVVFQSRKRFENLYELPSSFDCELLLLNGPLRVLLIYLEYQGQRVFILDQLITDDLLLNSGKGLIVCTHLLEDLNLKRN
jgi:hypothetical protein